MPIDATNGLSAVSSPTGEWRGALDPISARRSGFGFSSKPADLAVRVEPEDAHLRGVVRRHRLRRDRDVRVALDVRVDQLGEVHPVDVIAGEDQEVLRVGVAEMPRGLPHGVGRALKPLLALGRLLGGQHLDEPVGEHVQVIGLGDVPVERRRVELRQHVDPLESGVQAVAQRNVDQPVLAADRDRRLRSQMRERKQPRAPAAPEDDGQDVVHRGDCMSGVRHGATVAAVYRRTGSRGRRRFRSAGRRRRASARSRPTWTSTDRVSIDWS